MRVPGPGGPAERERVGERFGAGRPGRGTAPARSSPPRRGCSEEPQPRTNSAAPSPLTRASAVVGGRRSEQPARLVDRDEPARIGVQGRGQDLVVRQARPDHDPALAVGGRRRGARRGRAGPAPARRPGSGARAARGRSPGRRPATPSRPGAAPPRSRPARARPGGTPPRPPTRAADLGHLETGERGEVLAHPGDAGPDDPRPGRPAGGARRRAEVAHLGQSSTASSPGAARSSWTSAAPQASQRSRLRQRPQASRRARPFRLSTATTGRPGSLSAAARITEASREG